jgi:hypothetical protein
MFLHTARNLILSPSKQKMESSDRGHGNQCSNPSTNLRASRFRLDSKYCESNIDNALPPNDRGMDESLGPNYEPVPAKEDSIEHTTEDFARLTTGMDVQDSFEGTEEDFAGWTTGMDVENSFEHTEEDFAQLMTGMAMEPMDQPIPALDKSIDQDHYGLMRMATTPATPSTPTQATGTPDTLPTTGSKSQGSTHEESQRSRLGPFRMRFRSPRKTVQCRPLVNAALSASKFPLLSRCHDVGILQLKTDENALLSELVTYQKDQDKSRKDREAIVITVRAPKARSSVSFVQVPKSKNGARYRKNAKRSKWIPKMLAQSLDTDVIEESGQEKAAEYLMQELAEQYPRAYERATKKLGYNGKRMDVFATSAMWKEANVGFLSRRVIKRCTRGYFGTSLFASEAHERKLTESMPTVERGESTVDGIVMNHFLVRLEAVITKLLTETWKDVRFELLEVIVGGDHGQGKFGEIAKFVIRGANNQVIDKHTYQIGFIDCKKDTYAIFMATIGKELNKSIKNIVNKWVHMSTEGQSVVTVEFVDPPIDGATNQANLWAIKVLSTGDLKYLSMILGKVNMDPHWCPFCTLSAQEWKIRGHERGLLWTLDSMEAVRTKIENGELNNTAKNRCGCTDKPALDAFKVSQYVLPALHTMMGMGNDAFKHFFEYIDQRHELIGEEEREAREKLWEVSVDLKVELQLHEKRKEEREFEIFMLQLEQSRIEKQKKEKDGRKFRHSLASRREMSQEIEGIKSEVARIKAGNKEDKTNLEYLAARRRKLKAELTKIRQEDRRTKDCFMRQQLDDCLKHYGVDRGACHGGDFTGVALLILNNKIEEIFDSIKQILLSNADSKVPPSEIKEQVNRRIGLFVLMDDIFSFARKPQAQLSDDLFIKYEERIDTLMMNWESMGLSMTTVKRHLVEDHLIEQMRLHGDLCEYFEDFVELMHQNQKKKTRRGKIRDFETRAKYYNSMEYLAINPDVQKAGKAMMDSTKRRFKKERGPRRDEIDRELRVQRREEMYAQTLAQANVKLPSGFNLNLEDCIANGSSSSAHSGPSSDGNSRSVAESEENENPRSVAESEDSMPIGELSSEDSESSECASTIGDEDLDDDMALSSTSSDLNESTSSIESS